MKKPVRTKTVEGDIGRGLCATVVKEAEKYATEQEKTVCFPGSAPFSFRKVNRTKKNAFLAGAAFGRELALEEATAEFGNTRIAKVVKRIIGSLKNEKGVK